LRIVKSKEKGQKTKAEYNLGNTIYKNKKYSEAIANYKNASQLAKTDAEKHKAFHNLGNAYMQDKNYKSAVESYKNALKANPKDEKTRYNLALAKEMLKKNPPKPNPKNKNKDKEKKEDKEKKGEGENKKDKEKKGEEKNKKNKEKKEGDKQKKQQKTNKQQTDNVLKAIAKEEKKIQEKINANKTKTNTIVTEKDW
jgi:tetratricopeptide (TPR) repeat protein